MSVQKLVIDDRYCQIWRSGRLVVVDIMNMLFKLIDVVIHRHFIILFDQEKVIGGLYVLEIGGTTILVMESLTSLNNSELGRQRIIASLARS